MSILDLPADLAALVRAGLIRPLRPRVLAALTRRVIREGMRPHHVYDLYALDDPGRAALVYGERTVTWSQLAERIRRLADHLSSIGVERGDRVGIMLPNRPEFIETEAAVLSLRATAAFVNPRAPADAARALIERIAPKALVTDRDDLAGAPLLRVGDDYEAALRSASAEPRRGGRAGDGKVVVFTSGTTGRPKGAVRNFSDAGPAALAGLLRVVPFHRSDVHLVAAPLYHATGSGFAQIAQVLGNPLVLIDKFSPETFCEAIERNRVTSTAVVPTMLHELVSWKGARDHDLSSLRVVVCTGAPLREQTRAKARDLLGDVLYDLYGSTEMAWVTVATPADQRAKPGSVGKPVPGVRIRLLDAQGREVPAGEAGEIWATNRLVMEGYHADEALTRERLRDGFVSVRDVGRVDADGYLSIVDRADDMIISGGVNVYPAETETVLADHPAVAEAVVVGVPDEKWGQRVVAAVALDGDATEQQLIAWCKDRLPPAAVPKQIRFVDSLPHGDTGKIAKREIAAGWG